MRIIVSALFILLLAAHAAAVPVTFQVRMGHLIDEGRFDPGSDFVDVAGTFNGWGSDPLTPLSDDDNDDVYDITIDGFAPGTEIEYKFRINGAWDGTEEFPGYGNNRRFTVRESDNVILVWYNDELPTTGPPVAGFAANPESPRAGGMVSFQDLSAGAVETRHWSFPGASPATSTNTNPVVFYPDAGLYDVTLIVTGEQIADTLHVPGCVDVRELETDQLSWWNDTVFYEMFVRSFFDSDGDGTGDLAGATQKLDYLNDGDPATDSDLGVTGIWLMPICPSPSYHGYDATDYLNVNPDYGTLDDFRAFLAAAHARGIRVIIDFVMNHCSDQHPWFQASAANDPAYRDWFRWADNDPDQTGPWGQDVWHWRSGDWYYGLFSGAMPDLNYETPAVKQAMFDAAAFWLDEIGVDGFRLDAVLYIHEEGDQLQSTQSTLQFWQDYNAHVKAVKPDMMSVGEAWTGTSTVLEYVRDDRLDFCFEFDQSYAILNALNWSWANDLAVKVQSVYELYPLLQYGSFLTNHDQDRVLNVLGFDEARARVAAGIYLTLPGVPFLYYGEEIGMVGSGPHEVIRRPMQWTAGANAGFTTGTPWTQLNGNYPDYNVEVEQQDPNSLLSWYQRVIALRNDQPALRRGDLHALGGSDGRVLALLRRHAGETLLVLANTSADPTGTFTLDTYGPLLPAGDYTLEALLQAGESVEVNVDAAGALTGLSLQGHAFRVFRVPATSGVHGDADTPAAVSTLLQNHPNPFNPSTTISYRLPERGRVRLSVHDVSGRRVALLDDGLRAAGDHEQLWDGRDADGRPLPSGVYLARLATDTARASRRLVLLK